MVKTYFPRSLSPSRYDSFLASGWFRGSVMLYKMELLCIDNKVSSVVNIRMNLHQYQMRRSHQKLLRKNKERFTTVISRAKIDAQRESLYQLNKAKFKGFIHPTLSEYLYSGFFNTVFNTYEVAVYEHDRLIAVSYFDAGQHSVASLIGLFHPDNGKHSLGIYTMLCEIEWANRHNMKWYYPGYILDSDPSFNYKLTLGGYEYYNENKRWVKFDRFDPERTLASEFRQRMKELQGLLDLSRIPYTRELYPYFSMGYLPNWSDYYIRQPEFFLLKTRPNSLIIATYDLTEKKFMLMEVERDPNVNRFMHMEVSEDLKSEGVRNHELLVYQHLILSGETAAHILP